MQVAKAAAQENHLVIILQRRMIHPKSLPGDQRSQ
jgi:hypothetical protein